MYTIQLALATWNTLGVLSRLVVCMYTVQLALATWNILGVPSRLVVFIYIYTFPKLPESPSCSLYVYCTTYPSYLDVLSRLVVCMYMYSLPCYLKVRLVVCMYIVYSLTKLPESPYVKWAGVFSVVS